MRRVAGELGVQAGALYWHVANKQELLIAVASRILDPDLGAAQWPHEPATILLEFRRRLLSVRDGAEIAAVAHADRPARLPPAPELTGELKRRGVVEAPLVAQNLVRWVLGSVLTQQTAQSLATAAPDQRSEAAVVGHFDTEFVAGLQALLPLEARAQG